MFPSEVLDCAQRLITALRSKKLKIATAESCTGGLVASAITSIAGSSDVFDLGFVTYANSTKSDILGVDARLINRHGAVSEEVGRAMAEGALSRAKADIAVSVTGIAGPGGGSPAKPVGLVYVACASRQRETLVQRHVFGDIGRDAVRLASVRQALAMLEAAAR